MPKVIYVPLEFSIKKIDRLTTTKITEHIPCRYSVSTKWTSGSMENRQTLYSGEDCMKKMCISLRKHATNVINFEKKKILSLMLCKVDLMFSEKCPHVSSKQCMSLFFQF